MCSRSSETPSVFSCPKIYGELWHFLNSSHTGENMQKRFSLVNGTPTLKQTVREQNINYNLKADYCRLLRLCC